MTDIGRSYSAMFAAPNNNVATGKQRTLIGRVANRQIAAVARDLDTASIPAQNRTPENSDILGEAPWPASLRCSSLSPPSPGSRRRALSDPAARSDERRPEEAIEALLAGPRGGGNTSPEAVEDPARRALQFSSAAPISATWPRTSANTSATEPRCRRANEFAILITAREWTSQYEWYAHYPLALNGTRIVDYPPSSPHNAP